MEGSKCSFIWMIYICISVINADMEIVTKCSNHSLSIDIPFVTFCANTQATGSMIVIDGYYANTISYESCSCRIKSKQNQKIKFNNSIASQINQNIFSNENIKIEKRHGSASNSYNMKCGESSSIETDVDVYTNITVTLEKNYSSTESKCCLLLKGSQNASLYATCFVNSTTPPMVEKTATWSTEMMSTIKSSEFQSTAAESTELASTKASPEVPSTKASPEVPSTKASPEVPSTKASPEVPSTRRYQISTQGITKNDNILYIGVGTGGAAALLIIIILTSIVCKRRQQHKTPSESEQSQRCDDDDELEYNVLYISSGIQSNTVDDNRISCDVEGAYTTMDTDDNSKTKQWNTVDKSNIGTQPKSITLSDNGSNIAPKHSSVKHISSMDGGCEYAVVEKSKHSDDKQTPKNIITADNIEAEVDKTEDPPETQDIVDNTYAVVDKTKKRQNIDTSKNEMKDSDAEEGMSTSQKATGLTGDVTRPKSLENAEI